jgi:MerR family glutamine synthetase transcriptional repressor
MSDDVRRNLALFPIGIVQKLTELSARQIRYYEQQGLIRPIRTKGNQRLFSFRDVERLLEIKKLIDQGLNIAGIRKALGPAEQPTNLEDLPKEERVLSEGNRNHSDRDLHELLKRELIAQRERPGRPASLIQGELSRFFR